MASAAAFSLIAASVSANVRSMLPMRSWIGHGGIQVRHAGRRFDSDCSQRARSGNVARPLPDFVTEGLAEVLVTLEILRSVPCRTNVFGLTSAAANAISRIELMPTSFGFSRT